MKILIVDDDLSVVDFFRQASQAWGVAEIETAENGEQALACVIQNTYDLITLDIRMPGVSGLEILSPVRDMCPHAVIAIISGYVEDTSGFDLAGCADVLLGKPVDLAVFNALLNGAARIRKTMDDLKTLSVVALTDDKT